jgi:hypothetical protein
MPDTHSTSTTYMLDSKHVAQKTIGYDKVTKILMFFIAEMGLNYVSQNCVH